MTRFPLLLPVLLLSACDAPVPAGPTRPTDTSDTASDSGDSGAPSDSALGVDADGDGFSAAVDCNDANPVVNPGAREACNDVDDDCDGVVDQDTDYFPDGRQAFPDDDVDGAGDTARGAWVCDLPAGWVLTGGDCDDTDPNRRPGATERCNGVDDDCDGLLDDDDADLVASGVPGAVQGYPDLDADGFASLAPRWACTAPTPPWPTTPGTDCRDDDAKTFPGAAPSDDPTGCLRDRDDDDWGDDSPPAGVTPGSDCDDTRADVNPDAVEVPYDGVVSDCGPFSDDDADHDGHDAATRGGTDCDDDDDGIHPGAVDVPGDGIDQDCMGGDAPCTPGDAEACPVASCQALKSARPSAASGVYWLRPDPGQPAFRTRCEQTLDGGGWTLVAIASDDGRTTWNFANRARWTSTSATWDTGSIDDLVHDHRNAAYRTLPVEDVLFVHAPSGVWAAYHGVTDGQRSYAGWVDVYASVDGRCYAGNDGWNLSAGTLSAGFELCDTDLYISPQDKDEQSGCRKGSSDEDAWGPAWNSGNTSSSACPFNDPGAVASLGSDAYRPNEETRGVGFGRARHLNTAAEFSAGNRMALYAR
ncbi:MAG: hypothetical protein H6732_00025 [Alphaproteobacteria bacterium]|nr:hypothetical protein [Alphaproteobacteria bacterium]